MGWRYQDMQDGEKKVLGVVVVGVLVGALWLYGGLGDVSGDTASPTQKVIPIMDTDPQYFQQCKPLIDQQWTRHANRQFYHSTKVLNVESGPDYYTTIKGIKSHDYCVAVAFIRNDGKYDLTSLRCAIWPDHTEIDRDPCEAPSWKEWAAIKTLAAQELTRDAANQWVKPYENGMPQSLARAKAEDRAMMENDLMNQARRQGQREVECLHRGLDAWHSAAANNPKELVDSGVDGQTFVGRVYRACMDR